MLWKNAKEYLNRNQYTDAIYSLKRFIARYPADPHFTEAHEMLGRSYQAIEKHSEAIAPLRFYAQALPRSLAGWNAQLQLAESHLALHQLHRAAALGAEVFKKARPSGAIPESVNALLIQVRAHTLLRNTTRAQALWDSAQELLHASFEAQSIPAHLGGHSQLARLSLDLNACQSYRIRNQTLNEGQARDLLKRRGICLLGATATFKKVLETQTPQWGLLATRGFQSGVDQFREECSQLPRPPGSRSKAQISKFNSEIKEIIRIDCRQHLDSVLTLLKSSPEASPRPDQNQLEAILKTLERELPL